MAQVDVCFSWDHFMIEVSRRIGRNSIREFIQVLKEHGRAWAYFGEMREGKPQARIFQACKLETGEYAIRDSGYNSHEPPWAWVALVGKMILPPSCPPSPFRTGAAIRAEHTGTVMIPQYARPDVQVGE